jgi:hypothetical protein
VTARVRQAVKLLYENVEKNSAEIYQKLLAAGIKPDPANEALVFTAAKYYGALNKLAKQ